MTDAVERFNDPVTWELMTDPVVCSDGYTYERATAERLDKSPRTRAPLRILVDNVRLRGEIFEAYPRAQDAYPASRPPPAATLDVGALLPPRVLGRRASYKGALKEGRFDGPCTLRWACGDSFSGTAVNGAAQGEGHYVLAPRRVDGADLGLFGSTRGGTYAGGFANGRFHGAGTLRWNTGEVYAGAWQDGRMADGALQWPSGAKRVGNFSDPLPNGMFTDGQGTDVEFLLFHRRARVRLDGKTYEGTLDDTGRTLSYKWYGLTRRIELPQMPALPPYDEAISVAQVEVKAGRGT